MLKLNGAWQWKMPIPLAFSKLVFNVKVKFLLILWHFLMVFWLPVFQFSKPIFWLILKGFWFTPSYTLRVTPQSSGKFYFLWRYILVVSFISLPFVAVKLWMFKCFCGDAASMKPHFCGDGGVYWFWALSSLNMAQVCCNFDQR